MSHPRIGERATGARHDLIRLLHDEHERVLQEFEEFDRLQSLDACQACQRVVQRTFAQLKVLTSVEQQLLYPAVHDAIAGTDLIDQSQIEHARIQRVIAELESTEAGNERYWRRFRTLGEYVRRHVVDEEGELFPMLSCVPIDWVQLYDDISTRHTELAEELGVAGLPPLPRRGETSERPRHEHDDERQGELALAGER